MNPVGRIAVGFDGSSDAEAAVGWAMMLAKQIDAEVVVVHAVGLLEHASGGGVADLEEAVAELTRKAGIEPTQVQWQVGDGDPCSVLIRAGRGGPINADLLVVGSRGQGVHAGLLLGSTSLELAEHSVVPLVIVPTGRAER
jgi:nucleotide-binding universal stress UspA family protein